MMMVLDATDSPSHEDFTFSGLPGFDPSAYFYHFDEEGHDYSIDMSAGCEEQPDMPHSTSEEDGDTPIRAFGTDKEHEHVVSAQEPTQISQSEESEMSPSTTLSQSSQGSTNLSSISTDIDLEKEKNNPYQHPSRPNRKRKQPQESLNWNPKTHRQEDYDRSAATTRYHYPPC